MTQAAHLPTVDPEAHLTDDVRSARLRAEDVDAHRDALRTRSTLTPAQQAELLARSIQEARDACAERDRVVAAKAAAAMTPDARELHLATRRKVHAAARVLERICRNPDALPGHIQSALDAVSEALKA